MTTRNVEHAAPKPDFITLDQLAAFVQDAMRSGATGTETVHAAVTFGGKLRSLRISVDTPVKGAPAELA